MKRPLLTINPEAGLLEPVIYCPSPHYDERPPKTIVDMIVIHGISLQPGRFGGQAIEDFFCNKLDPISDPYYASIAHLKVSSHLLIKRTGGVFYSDSTFVQIN